MLLHLCPVVWHFTEKPLIYQQCIACSRSPHNVLHSPTIVCLVFFLDGKKCGSAPEHWSSIAAVLQTTAVSYACVYHIAGNFREVQIFTIFMTHDQNAKIRTMKIWTRELFIPYVLYASLARSDVLTSDYGTIALFQTDIQRPTLSHGTYFVLC